MPDYRVPGVYVEEVPSGAHVIAPVGTSTAAFLGVAPKPEAFVNEAVLVYNWRQFLDRFTDAGSKSNPLSHAVFGFFQNGGGICYVVNVGVDGSILGGGRGRVGLDVLRPIDNVNIVCAPGFTDPASYAALVQHCSDMQKNAPRVAIFDPPEHFDSTDILLHPPDGSDAKPSTRSTPASETSTGASSGGEGPAQPEGTSPPHPGVGRAVTTAPWQRPSANEYGAIYIPRLVVSDPLARGTEVADVSPCGHMAGIWARTDATRGVQKAPANTQVLGALRLSYAIDHDEQAALNDAGFNCIRFFEGEGILAWGARTLAPPGSEYTYLNVRRLLNLLEQSIRRSTRWIVFEPNSYDLWKGIRRDVGAFLTYMWREGALKGRTPQEAFFVKCDEETNPPEATDLGQVRTEIGVAPVKPAEFVVFRIHQWEGSAVTVEGR
jgi:phage tail sheath protein FI